MRNNNTLIPLVALGILVLTSFMPIIQIIMLYADGAFLYLVEKLLNTSDNSILNFSNLMAGCICLISFYISNRVVAKIIWTILTVLFFLAFLTFITENFKFDKYPYFLPIMIEGIIVTLPLVFLGYLKEKRGTNQSI